MSKNVLPPFHRRGINAEASDKALQGLVAARDAYLELMTSKAEAQSTSEQQSARSQGLSGDAASLQSARKTSTPRVRGESRVDLRASLA
jgi:hypothetical protein